MSEAAFKLESPKASRPKIRRGGWAWGPVEGAKLRVLSLGAGVQSTTLALMAAHGEIGPMPDAALYAPTADTAATLEHLGWLKSGNVLPFPVLELDPAPVSLRQMIHNRVSRSGRSVSIPAYLDGKKLGQDRRQCTREFKVDRLTAAQRAMLGAKPRQRLPAGSAEIWIAFSTDEVVRAGASFDAWAVNRFPLLESGMSFADCVAWLTANGYPIPPRSKCRFCPFRTDADWAWLRDNDLKAWVDALAIDAMIRETPGVRARSYLHASRKPLAEVDLSTPEDRGQGMLMVCDAGCGL